MRQDRRRGDGELPPARRRLDLRHARPPGAGLQHALSAGGRPGELRIGRRRPAGGDALHRSEAAGALRRPDGRPRPGDGRFRSQLRRDDPGTHRPARTVSEPAGERVRRNRRRHGDEHPAAQPARGDRRHRVGRRAPGRGAAGQGTGTAHADPGPRLSHRRVHRGTGRNRAGLPHRPRIGNDAGSHRGRGRPQEGRAGRDRRQRDSVPGQQIASAREDCRPRAREGDRGNRRPARRVRPPRHAHRDRAAPGRGAGGRAEQPLQAHRVADVVRDHRSGDRGRASARPPAARSRGAVPRVPQGSGPAPDGARSGQGRGAHPHPGGPQGRARLPGRGHWLDPSLAESSGGKARPHRALLALRDPGTGHSRHAAPAPDRPRAREDHRGAGQAGRDHPRVAGHSRQRVAPAGHRHRRATGGAREVRGRAAHRDHRGRGRGLQHRGPDRR